MAKGMYRLTADHYFPGDLYLTNGTMVGEGTDYPVIGPPSFNMMPMDATAEKEYRDAQTGEKPKPEMPAAVLNPTGNNPAQGPRSQTGTISAPGGVHGPQGLAEPPRPVVDASAAKAMAVAAAVIPKDELDKAVEEERARLADAEAEKAMIADKVAAQEAARAKALAAAAGGAPAAGKPPEPPPAGAKEHGTVPAPHKK